MHLDDSLPVDPARVVSGLQERVLKDKKDLEDRLERGEISAEDFANQVNLLMTNLLKQASEALPAQQFKEIFGFDYAGQTAVLIDPKLAAANARAK